MRTASVIAVLVLSTAGAAHADALPAAPTAPAPPPVATAAPTADAGWYGKVPALVDAASVVAFWGGIRLVEDHHSAGGVLGLMGAMGLLGEIAYAPTNHFDHGRPGRGVASLVMRLGGLAALIAIEHANTTPCQTQESANCSIANRWLGEGLPWIALMAIDDGLLAWSPSVRPAAQLIPAPVDGGPGFALAGRF